VSGDVQIGTDLTAEGLVDHDHADHADQVDRKAAGRRARRRGLRLRRGTKVTGSAEGAIDDVVDELVAETAEAAQTSDTVGDEEDGYLLPPAPRGALVRANARAAARGRYAPLMAGAPTTTRQGEILNPALIAAPLDDEGVVIGRDRGSSSQVAHDPFTAYSKGIITSPHVSVLGDIGSGKSSLLKTVYALRPIILKNRRVVVLDRKDRDGEGEYCELTRRFGGTPFHMRIGGGGTRLNPLDSRILDTLGVSGGYGLVRSMAERARAGDPLDSWSAEALRQAFKYTLADAAAEGREALLDDLIGRLGVVDGVQAWSDYSPEARERIHQAGLEVRHLLNGTLADELAGLFDGPTSPHVELTAKLTTFDISQLPEDGPATAMVLAVAHAWLLGTLRKDRGRGTNFLMEEGWDLVSGPIARQINATQMVARGLGLCNIAAMHNIAQVPRDSKALSLLKEPQTVHIYRQDRLVDAQACVELYGLDPGSVELLGSLETGSHLLKVGTRPEILVEHVRSSIEVELTNTDSGMLLGGAR
jgi:hypothetical protein